MSLINNMLHDLEDRNAAFALNNDSIIVDLHSTDELVRETPSVSYRVLFLFVILCMVFIVYFSYDTNDITVQDFNNMSSTATDVAIPQAEITTSGLSGTSNGSEAEAEQELNTGLLDKYQTTQNFDNDLSLKLSSLGEIKQYEPVAGLNKEVNEDPVTIEEAPVIPENTLTDIRLFSLIGASVIEINISSIPVYKIYMLNKPDRLLLELKDIKLTKHIVNQVYNNEIIHRMRHTYRRNIGQLIFDLNAPVELISDEIITKEESENYVLRLELIPRVVDSDIFASEISVMGKELTAGLDKEDGVISSPEINKVVRTDNKTDQAESRFNQAVASYRAGDIANTINILQQLVKEFPGHIQSRELLAKILISQGDNNGAKSIIIDGLQHNSTNTVLMQIYAQLLINENKLELALNALNQLSPSIDAEPDYYALKAVILKKVKRYAEAAEIYQQLVQVNPANGLWWTGLGISLEGLNRNSDALQAYRKAIEDRSMTTDINKFIKKKIRGLSG